MGIGVSCMCSLADVTGIGMSCMWLSSRCLRNSHCDSLTQIKGVLAAAAERGPAFSVHIYVYGRSRAKGSIA